MIQVATRWRAFLRHQRELAAVQGFERQWATVCANCEGELPTPDERVNVDHCSARCAEAADLGNRF